MSYRTVLGAFDSVGARPRYLISESLFFSMFFFMNLRNGDLIHEDGVNWMHTVERE